MAKAVASGAALIPVYDVAHVAEVVDTTGDGDGPFLVEPVLLGRHVEELRKEGVVEVRHRHHEPPLLLAFLPHPDSHAPLGRRHLCGRHHLGSTEARHGRLQEAQRARTAMASDILLVSVALEERRAKARGRRAKDRSWRWRGGRG
ncbi:hypothetical protein BHE74_00046649 [Ensete ventricosum]|nr:hypothetical protein BHE74_00046649 [Ensete ventricosum]